MHKEKWFVTIYNLYIPIFEVASFIDVPKYILSFVCFTYVSILSEQAHSSVERAGLLGGVQFRLLPTDDRLKLRGDVLKQAIEKDRKEGFIPFYVRNVYLLKFRYLMQY